MKRCLLLLAVLAVASGLSAQGNNKYTQEDVLAVFAQYNPAVLEEAKGNASYNEIVQALANSFQRVKTPENEAELLAVVKNFDNSLRLFLIAQAYEEGLALQQASNIDLASLDKTTQQDLLEVFQSIYNTTLQIRDEEIKLCKKRISGGGGHRPGGAGQTDSACGHENSCGYTGGAGRIAGASVPRRPARGLAGPFPRDE